MEPLYIAAIIEERSLAVIEGYVAINQGLYKLHPLDKCFDDLFSTKI